MDFSDLDILDEFFGMGDDSNPFMMLIWMLPIILFVFYGQRIQLIITSRDIKKRMSELEQFRNDSRNELINYIKQKLSPNGDPTQKLDRFFDYFTIMPVDIDPNGMIPKIHHLVRSREDTTRKQVMSMFSEISTLEITKVQNLLEIVTTLQLLHRIVRHLFLTAKKQNNYPLILPLQMMLPFIMEQAEALKDAIPAFKQGQPIGDGIGPLVVGEMMLDTKKQKAEFETVYSESEFNDRIGLRPFWINKYSIGAGVTLTIAASLLPKSYSETDGIITLSGWQIKLFPALLLNIDFPLPK